MGVWIETEIIVKLNTSLMSHPVWVCGLKLVRRNTSLHAQESHPVWVCGLKQSLVVFLRAALESHPVWVCGLKHTLI